MCSRTVAGVGFVAVLVLAEAPRSQAGTSEAIDSLRSSLAAHLTSDDVPACFELLEAAASTITPTQLAELWVELHEGLITRLRHEEAVRTAEAEHVIRLAIHTGDHDDTAVSKARLANALELAKRHAEALPLWEASVEMRRRLHPRPRLVDLRCEVKLAGCLTELGKLDAALARLQSLLQQVQGTEHDSLEGAISNGLGTCLERMGRTRDALPYFQSALKAAREQHGAAPHVDIVTTLMNVGRCMQAQGSQDALATFMAARAVNDKLPNNEASHAVLCLYIGRCLRSARDTNAAIASFQEAVDTMRRLKPGRPDSVAAKGLIGIGLALQNAGRVGEGVAPLREALEIYRQIHAGDHSDIAEGLDNLGMALYFDGKLAEARRLLEDGLAMHERIHAGRAHPSLAYSLHHLAFICRTQGEYEKTLDLEQRALAVCREAYGSKHANLATQLDSVGTSLVALSRYDEALELGRQALAMRRDLYGGDHPDLSSSLHNLGSRLGVIGKHEDGLSHVEDALRMRERLYPSGHPSIASSLLKSADLLHQLGRPIEALSRAEAALGMYRRYYPHDHQEILGTLGTCSKCERALGRKDRWLQYSLDQLAMTRRLFPGDNNRVARALNQLSDVQHVLGQFRESIASNEEALQILERLKNPARLLLARCKACVASCLIEIGETERASLLLRELSELLAAEGADRGTLKISLCRDLARTQSDPLRWRLEALEVAEQLYGADSPELVTTLTNVARVHLYLHDRPDLARPYAERGIALLELFRPKSFDLDERDRGEFFARIAASRPYPVLRDICLRANQVEAALDYVESSRARSLLDLLSRADFDPLEDAQRLATARDDRDAAGRIAALRTQYRAASQTVAELQLRQNLVQTNANLHEEARAKLLQGIRERLAQAEGEFSIVLRERASIIKSTLEIASPVSTKELQATLRAGELLLYYSLDEQSSSVFLVTRDQVEVATLAEGDRAVGALVDRCFPPVTDTTFGRGLRPLTEAGPGPTKELEQLAAALIPEPVWSRVRHARRVILVPHSSLNRLPFEALVVGTATGEPRYWIDDGPPIAYVASASLLQFLRNRGTGNPNAHASAFVGLGDPIFQREDEALEYPSQGLFLTRVLPDLSGWTAGLRAKDVLLTYDGIELTDPASLSAAKSGNRDAATVPIEVWRAGERLSMQIGAGQIGIFIAPLPPAEAARAGLGGGLDETLLARTSELHREAAGPLHRLPGTRREIEGLAALFPARERRILFADQATEANLFVAVEGARFVHLATHCFTGGTRRADHGALALSMPGQPAAPRDDGFLRLDDLLEHWRGRLDGCEMVTLSACETRVGADSLREATWALPIGFLYAGAHSIVASHWPVADASTASLMIDFYRRFVEHGANRLDAFTQARRTLKAQSPDPRTWAAFIYIGDPN